MIEGFITVNHGGVVKIFGATDPIHAAWLLMRDTVRSIVFSILVLWI